MKSILPSISKDMEMWFIRWNCGLKDVQKALRAHYRSAEGSLACAAVFGRAPAVSPSKMISIPVPHQTFSENLLGMRRL
jgi:hypothetical protein